MMPSTTIIVTSEMTTVPVETVAPTTMAPITTITTQPPITMTTEKPVISMTPVYPVHPVTPEYQEYNQAYQREPAVQSTEDPLFVSEKSYNPQAPPLQEYPYYPVETKMDNSQPPVEDGVDNVYKYNNYIKREVNAEEMKSGLQSFLNNRF